MYDIVCQCLLFFILSQVSDLGSVVLRLLALGCLPPEVHHHLRVNHSLPVAPSPPPGVTPPECDPQRLQAWSRSPVGEGKDPALPEHMAKGSLVSLTSASEEDAVQTVAIAGDTHLNTTPSVETDESDAVPAWLISHNKGENHCSFR